MGTKLHSGLLWAALLGTAVGNVPAFAQATQSAPAPCSVIPDPDPCGKKPASGEKKPALERFPFPGQSAPSKSAPSLTGIAPAGAPSATPPSVSPDKKFPFPGEAGPSGSSPVSGGASSSSSSSTSADGEPNPADAADSAPELKDKGSEGQQTKQSGRHILHRVNPPGTKLQTQEERAAEDVDVAHFYMDRGDFHAAYLRGQDAVKLQPDDPEAHLVLAEAAAKLSKMDEAIAEYHACLKLDPTDKQAKAAHKALLRLQAQR